MVKSAWTCPAFRAFILARAARLSRNGKVPLSTWWTVSLLIPLRKKGGGIRPIAIGETFTRLISRVLLRAVNPSTFLSPYQYGVGSAGGAEPVVHAVRSLIPSLPNGLIKLDAKNAFNTVSRLEMHESVVLLVPRLTGIFKFLYRTPSTLVVSDPARVRDTTTIMSESGGRQGDPLMPLFFSLAVKSLVEELAQRFAASDGGVLLTWAYLDDIVIAPKVGVELADVLGFLESPAVKARYGLSFNALKCQQFDNDHLATEGAELLGSWVGGPDEEESSGSALTMEAATTLENSISILKMLPKHQALQLLRMCWHPVLGYLMRTLPLKVGTEGVKRFDEIVSGFLLDLTGDPSVDSGVVAAIASLPVRIGGLGLCSQAIVRPYALAASVILANSVLADRQLAVEDRLRELNGTALRAAEKALACSEDELFGFATTPHLQKLMMESKLERLWNTIYEKLEGDMARRIRFLENSGGFSRAWVRARPSVQYTSLNNEEVGYALKCLFLSKRTSSPPPSQVCPLCTQQWHPTHHRMCGTMRRERNRRHDAVRDSLVQVARMVGEAVKEPYVGPGPNLAELRADVRMTVDSEESWLDVGITCVEGYFIGSISATPAPPAWPTKAEVAERVAQAEAAAAGAPPVLQLARDHPDRKHPNPKVVRIRTKREMAIECSIGKALQKMFGEKDAHYKTAGINFVTPFIISSGGFAHPVASRVVDGLVGAKMNETTGNKGYFRDELGARICTNLVKSGRLAADNLGRHSHRFS